MVSCYSRQPLNSERASLTGIDWEHRSGQPLDGNNESRKVFRARLSIQKTLSYVVAFLMCITQKCLFSATPALLTASHLWQKIPVPMIHHFNTSRQV